MGAKSRIGLFAVIPWLLSIISILLGSAFYVIWRSTSLRLFEWIESVGIAEEVVILRSSMNGFKSHLPRFVLFSLPQALWLFAGCMAVHGIWRQGCRKTELAWLVALFVGSLLIEFGQAAALLSGVYDVVDVVCLIVLFAVALILIELFGGSIADEQTN